MAGVARQPRSADRSVEPAGPSADDEVAHSRTDAIGLPIIEAGAAAQPSGPREIDSSGLPILGASHDREERAFGREEESTNSSGIPIIRAEAGSAAQSGSGIPIIGSPATDSSANAATPDPSGLPIVGNNSTPETAATALIGVESPEVPRSSEENGNGRDASGRGSGRGTGKGEPPPKP